MQEVMKKSVSLHPSKNGRFFDRFGDFYHGNSRETVDFPDFFALYCQRPSIH